MSYFPTSTAVDAPAGRATSRHPWVPTLLLGSAVLLMSLFVAGCLWIRTHPAAISPDTAVLRWFVEHRNGFWTFVAELLSQATDPVGSAVAAAGVGIWLLVRHRDRVGVGYVVGAAAVSAVVIVLAKHLADRPRPPAPTQLVVETNGSFPSGHVTAAVSVYGAIGVLLAARSSTPSRRGVIVGATAALALLVAADRLYLGVHWLTDVIGGLVVGGAVLATTTALWFHFRQTDPAVAESGTDMMDSPGEAPSPPGLRRSGPTPTRKGHPA